MGANFKPYSPQVDSGVPWLGKVPKNWRVTKLRHVLRRRTERNRPDLPLLSVVREKGVIRRDATSLEENHNYIPDDLSNYKVVRAGQFAMNKMKAWQGSYGVSGHDGIVSPAYYVFDVSGVDASFFHVAIRSLAYVPAFTRASDGVRIGQWDLAEERMRGIPFLVPPSVEQGAIVRFLDHADRRIRSYIRTKQKLVELLLEQKQAIIHQAVTGQIDIRTGQSYPSYKRSGVKWLGLVPANWAVGPLKRFAARRRSAIKAGPFGSQVTADEMMGTDVKVYTQRNVIDRSPRDGVNYISTKKFEELLPFEVFPGDVLVTSRGTIGRTMLVTEDCERGILHPCLIRVQADPRTSLLNSL